MPTNETSWRCWLEKYIAALKEQRDQEKAMRAELQADIRRVRRREIMWLVIILLLLGIHGADLLLGLTP